jgi:Flp pilus assembly protein TadD
VASLAVLFAGCGGSTSDGSRAASSTPEQRRESAAMLQRGLRFLADDLGPEAMQALEQAHRLDPGSAAAALALAQAYRREDRFAAARTLLQELSESKEAAPEDAWRAREALAGLLLDGGDLPAAREVCETLLKSGRPSAAVFRLSGITAYRDGNLKRAVTDLEEAVRLEPQDASGFAALGLALLQSGDLPAAAEALERAEALDPNAQSPVGNLTKVYERMGRTSDAQAAMQRFQALYERKSSKRRLDPMRAKAIEAYEAGRLEEALQLFRRMLELVPRDPQTLAQAGSVFLALRRLDEARQSLEASLSIKPDNDFALTELARVQALREDLPAAIDLLQRAAKVNPRAPEPHYFLAGIYLSQGRQKEFEAERDAYQRLQANSPGGPLAPLPGSGGPP